MAWHHASLRAKRSNPAFYVEALDCFLASLPAMTIRTNIIITQGLI